MREHPLALLIDDEEDFLEIASVKLRAEGFETVLTHSVPEALAKADELVPDVILSDIFMPPGPNGWEFALAVRRDPKLRDVKFAFFTSLHDPMLDVPKADRPAVLAELKNVPVFSKIDDVDLLAKRVTEILGQD